ncbi:MAG: DUF6495 family protein [Cyclobacteriaceae bacterium]
MPKFRLLTADELQEFEQEFVNYLVVNGITAEDWVKMKEKSPKEASQIVDVFSDVIFEGVFQKAKFMDLRLEKEIRSYQCLADKLVVVVLTSTDEGVNFLEESSTIPSQAKIITAEKKYIEDRSVELFKLSQQGAEVSDGSLFKKLCMAF